MCLIVRQLELHASCRDIVQRGAEVLKLLDLAQVQVVAAEVQYLQQQLKNLPEWHPDPDN